MMNKYFIMISLYENEAYNNSSSLEVIAMKTKLIIDGNSFYEIDENCSKKEIDEKKSDESKEEENQIGYSFNFFGKLKKE